MAKKVGLKVLIGLTLLNFGCSHTPKLATFKNSILNLVDPASKKLSPPHNYEQDEEFSRQKQADFHFAMGETLSLEGQTEKAIEQFKSTVLYDEKSVKVRIRLAEEYVKGGFFAEALEQAEFALQLDGQHIPTRVLLGNLYSSLRMYDLAIAQFQVVLDIEPNHSEAPLFIGAIYAEQKKYDEAISHFRALVKGKDKSRNHVYYYYIGRIYFEQGTEKLDQAELAFSESLREKPSFRQSVLALAKLYLVKGQSKSAVQLLQSYQEKFSASREIAKMLSQLYIEDDQFDKALSQMEVTEGFEPSNLNLKIRIALMLVKLQRHQEAANKLQEVLLQVPDSDKVHFYLASVYEELKLSDKAMKHFDLVRVESNYYIESVLHSAHLSKSNGSLEEAQEKLVTAIKNSPEEPQLYAFYASLLEESKEYRKASKMLEGAVEKFPSHTQLKFYLGSMYDKSGDTKRTIEQMEKVIELDENHIQALNYLAYTYAEIGENLDFAEQLVNRAIELKPNDGYILDTKGWVLFKLGRTQEAIELLEQAHRLNGTESIIAEHLADAYYRYQLTDKAFAMYKKALESESDNSKIEKIRSKLAATNKQIQSFKSNSRMPASVAPQMQSGQGSR